MKQQNKEVLKFTDEELFLLEGLLKSYLSRTDVSFLDIEIKGTIQDYGIEHYACSPTVGSNTFWYE